MKTKTISAKTNSGAPATIPIVGWSVEVPRVIRIRHQPGAIPQPLQVTPKATKSAASTWNFKPIAASNAMQHSI